MMLFIKLGKNGGLDVTRIQLTIKLCRLKNLEYNRDNLDTIRDTLIDIAGYCILSLIEIDRKKNISVAEV